MSRDVLKLNFTTTSSWNNPHRLGFILYHFVLISLHSVLRVCRDKSTKIKYKPMKTHRKIIVIHSCLNILQEIILTLDFIAHRNQKPCTLISAFLAIFSFTKNSAIFNRWSPESWRISPNSSSGKILPLQANTFLKVLRIFLASYSFGSPWRVVNVFLPFRCWMRKSMNMLLD